MVVAWLIIFIGYISFFVMLLRYEVVAFRYIWSNRTLGEVTFQNEIAPGQIISVYLVGTLLVAICTMLVSTALLVVIGLTAAYFLGADKVTAALNLDGSGLQIQSLADGNILESIPSLVLTAMALYLVFFAVPFAFSQIFLTRPILQRKAEAMVIHQAHTLTQSRQRAHDHAAEAGGFADALGVDVGAGF
jgi:uncharacterized membrane protein YjgN (DUF898 family)